jgi:Cu/Ag efflux protein CusF
MACGALLLAGAALAQDHPHAGQMDMHNMPMASAPPAGRAAAPALAEGEVIKVDPQGKKVTLKHGAIKNLNMPPMTMDYQVQDPALFARLKPGSKIRFTAGRVNGAYTVLTVEDAQ